MGAYKGVSELWWKKQSDVMGFVQRICCWDYHKYPSIVRVTWPTHPCKACPLDYKAKQGSRARVGMEDPHKEKRKREEMRNDEGLMEEFGLRKNLQWRTRRVVVNFNKVKATLDQLENREVVPPEKKEEEDGGELEYTKLNKGHKKEIEDRVEDVKRAYYVKFCNLQYLSPKPVLVM